MPCGGLTQPAASSELGLRIVIQDKFCLATAYKDAKLSKCTSCSRRNGKDTCRFRDIRYIKRDAAGAFRGIGFQTKPAQTLGRVRFPESWNEKPRKEHVNIIKVRAMYPALSKASLTLRESVSLLRAFYQYSKERLSIWSIKKLSAGLAKLTSVRHVVRRLIVCLGSLASDSALQTLA